MFLQATCKASTDLLKLCFEHSHMSEEVSGSTMQDPLLEAHMAALQEPHEFRYFGQEVFPLAVQLVEINMGVYCADAHSRHDVDLLLELIPDPYLTKIGMRTDLGCVMLLTV